MPLLCITGLRAFMQRAIDKADRNFRGHMANNVHVLSAVPAPPGNPNGGLGDSVSDLVRAVREVRVTIPHVVNGIHVYRTRHTGRRQGTY